jgi:hypothetical protein
MAYPTTPAGAVFYPYVFSPDTKFNADGDYKAKLRLSGPSATKLKGQVDALIEKALDQAREENPKRKPKEANPPYVEVLDDNGQETGEVEFSFKQRAVITTKKGPLEMKPKVFDAKGTPIIEPVVIGNGSTVKIAYEPNPYSTSIGTGVSLRLKAMQVIELKEMNGAGDGANSFGFGEEEGYEFTSSSPFEDNNEELNAYEEPDEEVGIESDEDF